MRDGSRVTWFFTVSSEQARVLLIADTHLGFDLPFPPRVERRRRGHDFFANFRRALQPAFQGQIDLVIHGGDLFFRSKVPPALVEMAMDPLVEVAKHGVPVFIVPGNHERSRIPLHLWAALPNLHIFDAPKTLVCSVGGASIALSGFPFARAVRDVFRELVERTGYRAVAADLRILCMHQIVEGSQVGPSDYTFRSGPEVIRGRDLPGGFDAILCGHIHRAQKLRHDLASRPLAAPVIYPGSVERTSFAERDEKKMYAIVKFDLNRPPKGRSPEVSFIPLPARPMVNLFLEPHRQSEESLITGLRDRLQGLDPEAVVRVQLRGPGSDDARHLLTAAFLRALAPPTMNIQLAFDRTQFRGKNR